jgi:hypothetical protein
MSILIHLSCAYEMRRTHFLCYCWKGEHIVCVIVGKENTLFVLLLERRTHCLCYCWKGEHIVCVIVGKEKTLFVLLLERRTHCLCYCWKGEHIVCVIVEKENTLFVLLLETCCMYCSYINFWICLFWYISYVFRKRK